MTYEVNLKLNPVSYKLLKEILQTNLEAVELQQKQISETLNTTFLEQTDIANLNRYLFEVILPQEMLLKEVSVALEEAKKERKLIIS